MEFVVFLELVNFFDRNILFSRNSYVTKEAFSCLKVTVFIGLKDSECRDVEIPQDLDLVAFDQL